MCLCIAPVHVQICIGYTPSATDLGEFPGDGTLRGTLYLNISKTKVNYDARIIKAFFYIRIRKYASAFLCSLKMHLQPLRKLLRFFNMLWF